MTTQETEQTIISNEKLVRFAINKYHPNFIGDDDVVQAGRIGLWKACANYDSSKSKFSTYATRCILNEIKAELRSRTKVWQFGSIASLDEPLYIDNDGTAITLAHCISDPNDEYCIIDYDLSYLKRKLSERDAEVFNMSICGFSPVEIGKAFGITRARVYQIMKKIQKIIKEM